MKAALNPHLRAAARSLLWAATRQSCSGFIINTSAVRRYASGVGLYARTTSAPRIASQGSPDRFAISIISRTLPFESGAMTYRDFSRVSPATESGQGSRRCQARLSSSSCQRKRGLHPEWNGCRILAVHVRGFPGAARRVARTHAFHCAPLPWRVGRHAAMHQQRQRDRLAPRRGGQGSGAGTLSGRGAASRATPERQA
jgi:hypothetical protein